ncbi:MAG: MgtC/SapB family protein [Pseudonocardiales bacterium]|nr:MgtC/SapB family protein [Pseudonocardiales bacterium]
MSAITFGEPFGQGWVQAGELALAFVLSSLIGFEREWRHKSAGLRTHTIVGVAAALIMMVSKYGFTDVLGTHVVLDPSRVAAQIVSGIGFIGGGLIFVRRDVVRGLTTAAVVWLTAAVGMAVGAGLPILAVLVTAGHFVVVYGFTPLAARLPGARNALSQLGMIYLDGHGVLRRALAECTQCGFAVSHLSADRVTDRLAIPSGSEGGYDEHAAPGAVSVTLQVEGSGSVADLAAALAEIDGMLAVNARDVTFTTE